uniref:Uncharacterized protein n=1 Tax=Knipowitschia caucasica TaxID=637954 RepID=A0AAV2KHA9_KNICA
MEMEGSGRQRGSGAASGPLCFWTVARTKRQTHHKWLFLLMSLQRAVIGRNDNTKKPQRSAHGGRPQVLGGTTRALRTTRDRTRRCLNDGPLGNMRAGLIRAAASHPPARSRTTHIRKRLAVLGAETANRSRGREM